MNDIVIYCTEIIVSIPDDSIPEANENVIGEDVLSTLLSSILREKRQALLRQPEVAAMLEQRRLGQFLVENQRN